MFFLHICREKIIFISISGKIATISRIIHFPLKIISIFRSICTSYHTSIEIFLIIYRIILHQNINSFKKFITLKKNFLFDIDLGLLFLNPSINRKNRRNQKRNNDNHNKEFYDGEGFF